MRILVILGVFILLAPQTHADGPTKFVGLNVNSPLSDLISPYIQKLKLEKIEAFLSELKRGQIFPDVVWDVQSPKAVNSTIPLSVQRIFARIQLEAFGRDRVFSLVPSDISGPAECLCGRKEIAVAPEFSSYYLRQGVAGKKAITFVLAHELSHYIIELYIQRYSPNSSSPNGLPSQRLVSAVSETPYSSNLNVITLAQTFLKSFGPVAAAHAEVDATAFLIMKKLGNGTNEILSAQKLALDSDSDTLSLFGNRHVSMGSPLSVVFETSNPDAIDEVYFNLRSIEPLIRIETLKATVR